MTRRCDMLQASVRFVTVVLCPSCAILLYCGCLNSLVVCTSRIKGYEKRLISHACWCCLGRARRSRDAVSTTVLHLHKLRLGFLGLASGQTCEIDPRRHLTLTG